MESLTTELLRDQFDIVFLHNCIICKSNMKKEEYYSGKLGIHC